eukprot:scaffold83324_cov34-Tisochrysis_lutea.AAC.5
MTLYSIQICQLSHLSGLEIGAPIDAAEEERGRKRASERACRHRAQGAAPRRCRCRRQREEGRSLRRHRPIRAY